MDREGALLYQNTGIDSARAYRVRFARYPQGFFLGLSRVGFKRDPNKLCDQWLVRSQKSSAAHHLKIHVAWLYGPKTSVGVRTIFVDLRSKVECNQRAL